MADFNKYYRLENFEDRESEFPNRRKLIHDPDEPDPNVYTVQRDEGNITKEGTPFSASVMNNFDKKIQSMFPLRYGITTSNGEPYGLDNDSIKDIFGNSNIAAETKTFDIWFYQRDKRYLHRRLNPQEDNYGRNSGRYFALGNLVILNVGFTNAAIKETADTQLILGPIPQNIYPSNILGDVSCIVSDFTIKTNTSFIDSSLTTKARIFRNVEGSGNAFIGFYTGNGGDSLRVYKITNRKVDCRLTAIYIR